VGIVTITERQPLRSIEGDLFLLHVQA
jgi:hypothetical protein